MKVGEAYVGEDGQWSYYKEKDVMKFEHTTYNSEFALHALAEGFTVYVAHPDGSVDQVFNAWEIADADGHLFVIRKENHNG